MRNNHFIFPGSSSDHNIQSIPEASNPFSFGMPDMNSHWSSSVSMANVNHSFGSGGTPPPYVPFVFGGGHIPQPIPMVRGWNIPSSKPNPSFNAPGWSAQMGGQFTSYIPFVIPSSSTSIPTNNFIMANITLTSSVSSGGAQFYSMGNPQHKVPSSGGNIYNSYHVAFSSKAASIGMVPLQPFMN